MAATTSTPRTRQRSAPTQKTAPKVEETTVVVDDVEEVEDDALVREVFILDNRGRTRNGEGKQVYWHLYERGARGQIFVDPDVVEVKVLVVRNTKANV